MSTINIVVPCHNESRRLNVVRFRGFAANHKNIRFTMVNDGSRDNTLDLLNHLASANSTQFEILDLPQNCGKAEAVRRGVLTAARSRPDYFGFWDADLATPLEAIPDFVSVLDRRCDISLLLGVRIPLLGHNVRRQRLRRLLGLAFARFASAALGTRCQDTQCGAKVFRTSQETLAAFSQPFSSRWIFDVELMARLVRLRRETSKSSLREIVYEFPLDEWEDVAGSKLKRGDFFKAANELRAIWWRYLRPGALQFIPAPTGLETQGDSEQAAPRRAA